MEKNRWSGVVTPLIASLTLGLAPFTPEPHLVEKLRWVFVEGGAGMQAIDVFDLAMHGAPWVWLVVAVGQALVGSPKAPPREEQASP